MHEVTREELAQFLGDEDFAEVVAEARTTRFPDHVTSVIEKLMFVCFPIFVYVLWTRWLHLPAPTRVQLAICWYLQRGPARRMIQAFRGVGKSWITCAYCVWRLWRNFQVRVLIVSANEKKATENAIFIKQLINTVDFLAVLRGGERDSALSFDVGPAEPSPSPSVRCDGIFGQITGARADIILADDVEVPKNSETEAMREKLDDRTKEFAAVKTRRPDQQAEIIWLGTPQSEESIYRGLPEKGYDIRIWPVRYPLEKSLIHYGPYLAPELRQDLVERPSLMQGTSSTLGGAPTDPERFGDLDLIETEAEYRAAGFMLQFMLDTRLRDAEKYPLKLRDLIVATWDVATKAPVSVTWAACKQTLMEGLPNVGFDGDRYHQPMHAADDFVEYQGSVMFIDPSGRGKDETAYAVTRMLNGWIYLVRAGGLPGGYDTGTLEALAVIAKEERVNAVHVEGNFGDGMYLQLLAPVLKRVYPVTLEEYTVSGQKEARILDKLEPVIQGHRLVVSKSVIERDYHDTEQRENRLFYQLTHITRDRGSLKHDDRIDVLAEAVGYWVDHMNRDTLRAEEDHKERLLKEELARFMKSAKRGTRTNWRYV